MAAQLIEACNDKDIVRLKGLLKQPNIHEYINDVIPLNTISNYKVTNISESTALGFACRYNDMEYVQSLLEHGARDDVFSAGWCPVHFACYSKMYALDKTKLLIRRNGENMQRQTTDRGFMPLVLAINQDNLDVVTWLLETGSDLAAIDKDSQTELHRASSWGKTDAVHILLMYGANINAADKAGKQVLHSAIRHGGYNTVKTLVAHPDCDLTYEWIDVEIMVTQKAQTFLEFSKSVSFLEQNDKIKVSVLLSAIDCDPRNGLQRHSEYISKLRERLLKHENSSTSEKLISKIKATQRKVRQLQNKWWPSQEDREKMATLRREMDALKERMREITNVFPFEAPPGEIRYRDEVIAEAISYQRNYLTAILDFNQVKDTPCLCNMLSVHENHEISTKSHSQDKTRVLLDALAGKKSKVWATCFLDALRHNATLAKAAIVIDDTLGDPDKLAEVINLLTIQDKKKSKPS